MPKWYSMLGKVYGRLTVIEEWYGTDCRCRCACGEEKVADRYRLRRGLTQSCGCLHREVTKRVSTTHGASSTRLYRAWATMKQRCYYPLHHSYPWYGGKGVRVCDTWRDSFAAFQASRARGRQPIFKASPFIVSIGTPAQNTAPMIEPALTPVTQSNDRNALLHQHIQHADMRRAARDTAT